MDFGMIGPAIVLGLGCIGSSIGCGIGGMASHAVMSRVEENHGKFIGMAAMPASQSIFGFVLMILMRDSIKAGTLSALSGIGIGTAVGLTQDQRPAVVVFTRKPAAIGSVPEKLDG